MTDEQKFKIVFISNHAIESDAEWSRPEYQNLSEGDAKTQCQSLAQKCSDDDRYYPVVKPQSYVLWRGMEEFI